MARPDLATPRVHIRLAEVEYFPPYPPEYVRRESGQLEVVWLEESAGSIPKLTLGSFWRDRVVQPDVFMGDEVFCSEEVLKDQPWTMVNSDGLVGGPGKWRVPQDHYSLMGEDVNGRTQFFHDAPLIHSYTESGTELLIPCYEIFRRFYAGSTEIANALLGGHWKSGLKDLIDLRLSGVSENGECYEVFPLVGLRDIACMFISLFEQNAIAGRRAAEIFANIESRRQAEPGRAHWINAIPPWQDYPLKFSFIGKRLGPRGPILVLRIVTSEFPRMTLPITRVDARSITSVFDEEATSTPHRMALEDKKDQNDSATFRAPTDIRQAQKVTHFATSDVWEGLVPLKRRHIKERFVDINPSPTGEPPPVRKLRLATGKRNSTGKAPGASLSSNSHNEITDRFKAVAVCFEEMLQAGDLASRTDFALIRPLRVGQITFCELPMQVGEVNMPWAVVNPLEPRPRLCWVSELKTATDGLRLYWVELEIVHPRRTFKSLLVRPKDPQGPLSAAAQESILKAAVWGKGKWGAGNLTTLSVEATWIAVRHSFESQAMRRGHMLSSIERIRRRA